MTTNLTLIASAVLYLFASAIIGLHIRKQANHQNQDDQLTWAYSLAALGLIAHAYYAWQTSVSNGTLDLSLSAMIIVVSAILIFIFLLAALVMPIRRLGVLVYPLTVISLLFAWAWNSESQTHTLHSRAFVSHILISVLAYCLLAIATIQALLYVYQEQQIKNRRNPAMLMALPPLQTMETLLFRLIGSGFICLSLTLISGAIFSQQIFGYAFEFKHHTVLALLGWLVFAILLFKRFRQGLRGSQATLWTIAGFLLIQLGYFGTKIVSESLQLQ